jgi:hypothetical protein
VALERLAGSATLAAGSMGAAGVAGGIGGRAYTSNPGWMGMYGGTAAAAKGPGFWGGAVGSGLKSAGAMVGGIGAGIAGGMAGGALVSQFTDNPWMQAGGQIAGTVGGMALIQNAGKIYPWAARGAAALGVGGAAAALGTAGAGWALGSAVSGGMDRLAQGAGYDNFGDQFYRQSMGGEAKLRELAKPSEFWKVYQALRARRDAWFKKTGVYIKTRQFAEMTADDPNSRAWLAAMGPSRVPASPRQANMENWMAEAQAVNMRDSR